VGTINDLEVQFLVQELGAPSTTYNDGWFAWLGGKGFTGAYNDRWYKYLGSLGLTGGLNDRLNKAFCSSLFNTDVLWILADGTWVDSNTWLDDDVWIDA
jgi:hypothetical protein